MVSSFLFASLDLHVDLCQAAFDLFVIIMATCNMLDRPRGPQHNVVSEMRRDGAVWFLVRLLL